MAKPMTNEMSEFWTPTPKVVEPAAAGGVPSDAIVLFDGHNLDAWQMEDGSDARWDVHNGIVIQNHTEIQGTTEWIGFPKVQAHGDGPIRLQSHGDPSEPISFRNIWIRPMD